MSPNTFPPPLKRFRLYGSIWFNATARQRAALHLAWRLPPTLRDQALKHLAPDTFKRLNQYRKELLPGFHHNERKELFYSIRELIERKVLFIHIPKCAGISAAQTLFGHCVPHATFADYIMLLRMPSKPFCRVCTIVRNPWDRLVSAYHFLREGGFDSETARSITPWVKRFPSFGDFVRYLVNDPAPISCLPPLAPQHLWIQSPNGSLACDFIGRCEAFRESLHRIGELASPPRRIDAPPPRLNASSRQRDYRSYYDDETAELAAQLYARDIRLFGYRFEP